MSNTDLARTVLHPLHAARGAKLVDFGGWEMPLHYGSQIEEHHAVRSAAGLFDVSHMQVLDVLGPGARPFLRHALANDVDRLPAPGRALYSCLLEPSGGIRDDLIVYWVATDRYRIVLNAATARSDIEWLAALAAPGAADVTLVPRPDLAILAVQGPNARAACWAAFPGSREASEPLERFSCAFHHDHFIARTGYTGEDGFEIVLPALLATHAWKALEAAGGRPCGLGARDTLRLEAGMALYGQDMDATVTPAEAGLAWTVDTSGTRDFVGRAALGDRAPRWKTVGLVLLDPGVLRAHCEVTTAAGEGITTSGSFAPTLKRSIALARVPLATAVGERVTVALRGRPAAAIVVAHPFVRNGRSRIDAALPGASPS